MRVVLFTCRRDREKAALATRTVPDGWPVAWIVSPEDADLDAPAGVDLLVRPFDRGRNLAGRSAVLGVSGVLAEQSLQFGRVAKMDSDCLVLDWGPFLEGDLAGMAHLGVPLAAYGLCYALSESSAQEARRRVLAADRLGATLTGEDIWVTASALAGGGVDARLPIGAFWESAHNGETPPAGRVAIHCGATKHAPREGGRVAAEMSRLGDLCKAWRRV